MIKQLIKQVSKGIIIFSLLLAPLFVSPAISFAADYNPVPADVCQGDATNNPACTASSDDPITGPNGIIMKIANLIAFAAGAIAVFMILFSAFRLIKSGGDSGKVTVARETIIYSLVGLVVIIAARLIVGLVITKL